MAKNSESKDDSAEWSNSFGGMATAWKPNGKGDVLIGVLESRERVDNDQGDFVSYRIRNEKDGELYSLAGFAADKGLGRVPDGARVRVTFLGEMKMKLGSAHNFMVQVSRGVVLLDKPVMVANENSEPEF